MEVRTVLESRSCSKLCLQDCFSSLFLILENVKNFHFHIECICKALGRGSYVVKSLFREEESPIELSSLSNKFVSEMERKERDMQKKPTKNQPTNKPKNLISGMKIDNQESDPTSGTCFSYTFRGQI